MQNKDCTYACSTISCQWTANETSLLLHVQYHGLIYHSTLLIGYYYLLILHSFRLEYMNVCLSLPQEGSTTSTSELLQMTTERVGILFSTTLNTTDNKSVQASLVRDNISKLNCDCAY